MANLTRVATLTVSEAERERVPGETYATRETGRTVHHDVELWIDADDILRYLAWRAARAKGRKATARGGAIVAKVTATRYTIKPDYAEEA